MSTTAALVVLIGALALRAPAEDRTPALVPLCPGLTIVTAIDEPAGDYESIKTIETIRQGKISMSYSAEVASGEAGGVRRVRTGRTILLEDLRSAARYARNFGEGLPAVQPGTTALGASASVLVSLKTRGEAEFALPDEGLLVSLERTAGDRVTADDIRFVSGTIRRVGAATVPVVVNDRRVELPAIHARGEFFGAEAEFFFLDDPGNPLALRYAVPRGEFSDLLGAMASLFSEKDQPADGEARDVLQVVKIIHRCESAASTAAGGTKTSASPNAARGPEGGGAQVLERALAERGRAEVYSIFFSFNSDAIREESNPTIAEIAAVLAKHPAWALSIEGHTDSVGSVEDNLDLSRRRAAAVKQALVGQHGVSPGRLAIAGYGESRPRDTNDTLEGRARNRRVELVRQ